MRKLLFPVALVAALVAMPAAADNDTITNKAAQVQIKVPAGWKSKGDGEDLVLYDASKDTAIEFDLVDADDLKTASKRLGKNLASKVDGLTWTKEEKVDVNGMKGVALVGDGSIKKTNVDLAVLILDTPNPDKDLIAVAIAEDAKLAKHKKEINYVFDHISPMK